MLRKLDLVSLRVRDWPAAVAWYTDKLGLTVEGAHDDPFCMMSFPEGDTFLALDGTNPVAEAKGNCIPSILVDDLPQTVSELTRRGVTFSRDLEENDEGYRMATLVDLEGNPVNLYEYV